MFFWIDIYTQKLNIVCSQKACFKCCTDMNCEGHRETREKESIINGTHEINKLANAKRALAIKPGLFRDPAFQYLGETILIWSLSDYLSNTKWREEAIRKSLRNMESRKQGMMVEKESQLRRRQKNGCSDSEVSCEDVRLVASMSSPSKESRKKRFHRIMNELYEKSVDDR